MYFAIHCIDKPGSSDLRAATRAGHLAYLEAVRERILAGGPLLGLDGGPIGSLMIVDFTDRKAAIAFAADDPRHATSLRAQRAMLR